MNQVKLLRVHFTPDRADTMVYTEKGTVHCVCLATGTQRALAFQGFEAGRDTLKFRYPAAAYGLDCQGQAQCHAAVQVNLSDSGFDSFFISGTQNC